MKITFGLFASLMVLLSLSTKVFSQNTLDLNTFNLYDLDIPAEMIADTGVPNIESKNKIFIPGRRFTYNYTLTKNGRKYLFAVVPGEIKKSDGTGAIDWAWLPLDSVPADKKIHPIKAIELSVYRNKKKGFGAPPPDYTEIKYEFLNEGRRILHGETTTVVERSRDIFLHQPRSYGFVLTEFNPMPHLLFPLDVGKTWSRILTAPQTFFDKAKVKVDSISEFFNVNVEYKFTGQADISTAIAIVRCTKIEAIGEMISGSTFATFYFNEQWGFLKLEYQNIDGSQLVLQLIDIKDAD